MLAGCRDAAASSPLFELLSPAHTGVTFTNALPEKADFNILNYLYYYNGGGVAVGDVNNDGLPDLYFTSNLGANTLYLNKGNYRFEDITARAGVADTIGWKTGVTMADVDGDGYVDIYVSAVDYLSMHGRNVLYVNNRDGTFTDRTREFGLEHSGYSTQALFFDYDGDGDLDMYLLNHSVHSERGVSAAPQRSPRHPRAGDKLFRNDGGHFVDVSEQAHIYGGVEGYGLGVVASDLNLDGCPDLYVANDFQENDFVYYNNCDGTFTESVARSMPHTSRFSMGVDAADFNNDGRPDLAVLDMLPDRENILKTSANAESFNLFNLKTKAGYWPQYARNTLQLNRGAPSAGRRAPRAARFSDIGYLAGVAATDWSWAPLFADLDNDGYKDLFITNGIFRRPNDLDYINYVGNDAVQASLARGITRDNLTLLDRMPQVPLVKYVFRNNGNLTFTNVAAAWGIGQAGFSNGAAYVDLNNSGALDLVVNNVNGVASIYRNHAREASGNHFLAVQLRGDRGNSDGIGAKVSIRYRGGSHSSDGAAIGMTQLLEQQPTRGFESSVDHRLHFGLGKATTIDSLTVVWPNRRFQVLTNVRADQLLTLSQKEATGVYDYRARSASPALFSDETARVHAEFRHRENDFVDFDREPFMPHLLSTEGPALAVGDVNGDGFDDIYVGGAAGQPGALFVQRRDGTFEPLAQPAFTADAAFEDVAAVFFDANGDGKQDLYVVSGGNEFTAAHDALQDRLYLNDGRGRFRRDTAALPRFAESGSCVTVGDFNRDGHPDLFVGRRAVAGRYGETPHSYLLANDGRGHFVDVSTEKSTGLADAGMVTSAAFVDYDGDGALDLVVVGEWMPVRLFHQESGRFVERVPDGLRTSNGWWNHVAVADVNRDGKPDLVLGNLGLNAYIKAAPAEPARLYVGDFAHNGSLQQILTFYKHGVSYPLQGRDDIVRQIPQLRSRFPSYASFGAARIDDILPPELLRYATQLSAFDFASSVAINGGGGRFTLIPLPAEAQFSPVYASIARDFDGDGNIDLLVAGNFYGVTPVQGRYDAGYGVLLRGRGDGRFAAVDMEASNVVIDGQVRRMATLRSAAIPGGDGVLIVVARNDGVLEILRPGQSLGSLVVAGHSRSAQRPHL